MSGTGIVVICLIMLLIGIGCQSCVDIHATENVDKPTFDPEKFMKMMESFTYDMNTGEWVLGEYDGEEQPYVEMLASLNQPIENWDINGVTPIPEMFYVGEI